jgi:hypothetical protein
LNNDSSSEETETKQEEPVYSLDEQIANRTEGKYANLDELLEAASKPAETTQHEYGNELIAKLDELSKQGVNVDLDFVTGQMVDYSTYDVENVNQALALVEMQIKSQEPDITQKELQYEMRKYKLDEDSYDDDEIELSKIQLMRDAKKARKSLEQNQKDIALPKGGVDPEKQRQMEEQAKVAQERLAKQLNDGLGKYEKESMKIGEETFDYTLTNDVKKKLEQTVFNTDKFFNKYVAEDGSIKPQLYNDMLWSIPEVRETMLKSFLNQATSTGKKEVVDNLKNTDFNKKAGKTPIMDYSIQGAISRHLENKK